MIRSAEETKRNSNFQATFHQNAASQTKRSSLKIETAFTSSVQLRAVSIFSRICFLGAIARSEPATFDKYRTELSFKHERDAEGMFCSASTVCISPQGALKKKSHLTVSSEIHKYSRFLSVWFDLLLLQEMFVKNKMLA